MASAEAIGRVDREVLERALRTLPASQHEAVVLCDVWEFTYPEIATIVEAPIGTVRSRIARGRARLAALLADLGRPRRGRGRRRVVSRNGDIERLSAHLDGEGWGPDEAPPSDERLGSMRALKGAIGALSAAERPAPHARSSIEALAEPPPPRFYQRARFWSLVAAVTAAAMFALGISTRNTSGETAAGMPTLLAQDHRTLGQRIGGPGVFTADPVAIRAHFAGHVPFAPESPRLPEAELVAGRRGHLQGRDLQLLTYRRRDEVLSLFVGEGELLEGCRRIENLSVCGERDGELGYALVGAAHPSVIAQLLAGRAAPPPPRRRRAAEPVATEAPDDRETDKPGDAPSPDPPAPSRRTKP